MIEKLSKYNYQVSCSLCGFWEDGFTDFYEAVDYKNENGWKNLKVGNEWVSHCSECIERG